MLYRVQQATMQTGKEPNTRVHVTRLGMLLRLIWLESRFFYTPCDSVRRLLSSTCCSIPHDVGRPLRYDQMICGVKAVCLPSGRQTNWGSGPQEAACKGPGTRKSSLMLNKLYEERRKWCHWCWLRSI